MLRIRLSRTGKKKQPSYRVVVADSEFKRDGRVVERIGHYNPLVEPLEYDIEEARALYWLSVGAQPSDAVRRLLDKQGTFDRLARLQAGEDFDALVAEYTGVEVSEPAAAMAAPAEEPSLLEEAQEVAAEAVDTITDAAAAGAAVATGVVAEMVDALTEDEEE